MREYMKDELATLDVVQKQTEALKIFLDEVERNLRETGSKNIPSLLAFTTVLCVLLVFSG